MNKFIKLDDTLIFIDSISLVYIEEIKTYSSSKQVYVPTGKCKTCVSLKNKEIYSWTFENRQLAIDKLSEIEEKLNGCERYT